MKIVSITGLFLGVFSAGIAAQAQTPIPLKSERETKADILDVKILKVVDKDPHNPLYWHPIIVTFGLRVRASACEKIQAAVLYGGQSGYENPLNPSDQYIKIVTQWEEGCATGSYGDPVEVQFDLKLSYDDPTTRSGQEMAKHAYFNTMSINFDIGMTGGHNRYKLYTLDYKNPADVKLTPVKTYTYVEGKVLEQK